MKQGWTTPSEENYLEWIYRLSAEGPVRPAVIAGKLGVKRPSATKAVASLARKGLVRHEPYGEIFLTEEGRTLGEAIVRRDTCLTKLLVGVLGMPPAEADPEVHRMEHVLSDEVLARLEVLVDFAGSSEAWIKRLRYRIALATAGAKEGGPIRVGRSPIHPGTEGEKEVGDT